MPADSEVRQCYRNLQGIAETIKSCGDNHETVTAVDQLSSRAPIDSADNCLEL